jgi:hypothetical protein
VPGTAEVLTEIVNVDVAVPPEVTVTEVGFRLAVTPVGTPETVRPGVPVKSFRDVMVMVDVPELP